MPVKRCRIRTNRKNKKKRSATTRESAARMELASLGTLLNSNCPTFWVIWLGSRWLTNPSQPCSFKPCPILKYPRVLSWKGQLEVMLASENKPSRLSSPLSLSDVACPWHSLPSLLVSPVARCCSHSEPFDFLSFRLNSVLYIIRPTAIQF